LRKPFVKYPSGSNVFIYVNQSGSMVPLKELGRLTKNDDESARMMLSAIEQFAEYDFCEIRKCFSSPFKNHDFNLEIKPQKSCPKVLRIATLGIPEENFKRFILLRAFITHGGSKNNVPKKDVDVSDKRARECLKWIEENGGVDF